jgi:CBS-domain-containing membrane protein
VLYCFEDDALDDVARNMAEQQVRRMPVLNHEKRLVGLLSLGDIGREAGAATAGEALSGVAQPSSKHDQAAERRSAGGGM